MKYSLSIMINRPIQFVFEFFTNDFAAILPELTKPGLNVKAEPISENQTLVGSKFRLVEPDVPFMLSGRPPFLQVGPMSPAAKRQAEAVVEVVSCKPNKEFSYRVTQQGFSDTTTYMFSELDSNTQLEFVFEPEAKGFFWELYIFSITKLLKWTGRQYLNRLKGLVESKPDP